MIKVYLPLYRGEIKELLSEIEEITLEKEEGIYLIYSSKNEVGKITLFPNWIEHYTDKHISPKERITVAFDLFDEKFYNTKVECG